MDDLVTWLHAHLDEDEQVAVSLGDVTDSTARNGIVSTSWPSVLDHLDRFGMTRMLAEVETKRRILDEYEAARSRYIALADARAGSLALTRPEPSDEERRAMDMADAYAHAICLLALPLADQPGYRDEWRP